MYMPRWCRAKGGHLCQPRYGQTDHDSAIQYLHACNLSVDLEPKAPPGYEEYIIAIKLDEYSLFRVGLLYSWQLKVKVVCLCFLVYSNN